MLQTNLVVISNGDIGFNTKGPVDVEDIFVEGQHKDDEDE